MTTQQYLPKKKKFSLFGLLFALVLLLTFVQFVISYRLATMGDRVRKAESRAVELEANNHLLTSQINKMGSLLEISTKANNLGFVRTTQVVHLKQEVPVAYGKLQD